MNTITVQGNVGKVEDLRVTASGKKVISFSIADSQGKDKPTTWFKISCFDDLAETVVGNER
jgi:single-strand DNA-binding protein